MNKVVLLGRITKPLEIKKTKSEINVLNFSIAVDKKYKKDETERTANFINCIAWDKTAEFIVKYFTKGDPIVLCGRLDTGKYIDEKTQETKYTTKIIVEEVEFCPRAKLAENTDVELNNEDFPF